MHVSEASEDSVHDVPDHLATLWTFWSNGLPCDYSVKSCGCVVVAILCFAKHEMFLPRFQTKHPVGGTAQQQGGEEISCFSVVFIITISKKKTE